MIDKLHMAHTDSTLEVFSLKLLLVDDEFFTRNRIMGKIDWSSLDIHEIEQADDGEKALEVCGTFQPDILLADVRMPRMDGIEMAYRLQEMYPGIKIIFISGYAEKNDLKNAKIGRASCRERV